jgi:hypothetical protein
MEAGSLREQVHLCLLLLFPLGPNPNLPFSMSASGGGLSSSYYGLETCSAPGWCLLNPIFAQLEACCLLFSSCSNCSCQSIGGWRFCFLNWPYSMGFLWQGCQPPGTFTIFPIQDALVAGFYMDNAAGRPRNLRSMIFHISQIAQSPSWSACEELQISVLSVREE